jgi:hypothetical protein
LSDATIANYSHVPPTPLVPTCSNQDVDKKQIDFNRKSHFDSLKLRDIFIQKGNKPWNKVKIEAHQSRMLDVLEAHYDDKR